MMTFMLLFSYSVTHTLNDTPDPYVHTIGRFVSLAHTHNLQGTSKDTDDECRIQQTQPEHLASVGRER